MSDDKVLSDPGKIGETNEISLNSGALPDKLKAGKASKLSGRVKGRVNRLSSQLSDLIKDKAAPQTQTVEAPQETQTVAGKEAQQVALGKEAEQASSTRKLLYVYCVVPADAPEEYGRIGIGGLDSLVHTIKYRNLAAVVSETPDGPPANTEKNVMDHQRVMQRVFGRTVGVPVAFATVVEGSETVLELLDENYNNYVDKLAKLKSTAERLAKDEEQSSAEGKNSDVIMNVLEQSAESAARIRQMSTAIGDEQKKEQKTAEHIADMVLARLADLIPKAPSVIQKETAPIEQQALKDQSAEIARINKRLDDLSQQLTLSEQLNVILADNRKRLDEQYTKLEKLSDALADKAASKAVSMAIEEGQEAMKSIVLHTLHEYFQTMPSAIQTYVDQTVASYVERIAAEQRIPQRETPTPPTPTTVTAMTCAACGIALQIGVRFCDHCGTPISNLPKRQTPRKRSPSRIYCTGCGAKLKPADVFCDHCGRTLDKAPQDAGE